MYSFKQHSFMKTETEALLFGVFMEKEAAFQLLDEAFSGELQELYDSRDLTYEAGSVVKLHTFGKIASKRIYFVGLGKREDVTKDSLRKAFGKAFKQLAKDHIQEASLAVDSLINLPLDDAVAFEAVGEAHALAPFVLKTYHTNKKSKPDIQLTELTLVSEAADRESNILKGISLGFALGEGANIARRLVHTPGNLLTATDLAEFAQGIADKHGFEIDILDKEEMVALGMGALLAVNQGSDEPPKLIVMRYQGKDTWDNPVALVGKGITFDTGGYSLKPKDGIVGMKMDMGGAAAVIGAMDTIGTVKPKVNVMAVIPATDNMISGNAFKPDDVIVSMSGKTIEIRNTDAEGRLVLADAITYAKTKGASKIIDVATLTGGVVVALGKDVTGAMTNNQEWYETVQKAADETGELIWQLPYFDHYKKQVQSSDIADLNNSPGRPAHAIMAGAFVGDFADKTPWVHLDIAGTAMKDTEHNLGPKGPTGVMTRTLAKVIINQNNR
ncbi:leucyl aminopeptidase [Evansella vedderi]|uniref:Probable cytosol aminopeptidase n=1 Tax=Evansella vedderi TaxID=38282 RepID=A0ABT9ZU13_9BACI|nr:leucyl aminopeptidase [Evansella vedderi]MDQ0254731.1 leucyl aminopeptidase [Evansella vedderi]